MTGVIENIPIMRFAQWSDFCKKKGESERDSLQLSERLMARMFSTERKCLCGKTNLKMVKWH
jgi:hypothetical protein